MSQKKAKYCCACRGKVDNSVKLIGFPREESERMVWLNRLGIKRENYKPYMRFCEVHLRADTSDFVGDSLRKNPLQNTTNSSDTIKTADKVHDHGQDLRGTARACVLPQEIIQTNTSNEPVVKMSSDLSCTSNLRSRMMIHTASPTCTSICSDSVSVETPQEMELSEQSLECYQNLSITPTHSSAGRPWLRYFGDIKTPDIQTPRGAKRCLDLARDTVCKAKKKIKMLEAQNYYLKKKVTALSESLQEVRNQNSLTEGAFATLKCDTYFYYHFSGSKIRK